MVDIRAAQFPLHLEAVREVFCEYANGLGIDLGFQDFEAELKSLPGKYAPPKGDVLLAWSNDEVIGCVAVRPLRDDVCEMKRLYVRPSGRGRQLGRRLALHAVQTARDAGYKAIRLDTLPDMQAAQQLYQSLGFHAIPAYVFNPVTGTKFLELDLTVTHASP